MKNYKISIIVPVYNVEDYIDKCVDSLINQTYCNLEIILIDDGSTDCSGKLCDLWAEKDRRITVIHKDNGGVVSARKAGAKCATGDYVCSVDSDDWIENDRISRFVRCGAATDADMVYMEGYYKDYGSVTELYSSDIQEKLYLGKEVKELIFPMIIDTKTCFWRKIREMQVCWGIKRPLFQKMWNKIDEQISMGDDCAHVLCCLLEAGSVFLMKECGYHYVMRADSITHSLNRESLKGIKIWTQMVRNQMKRHNCEKSLYLHMVFLETWYIMNCDYSLLMDEKDEFLYPFAKVKRGSRIAVYGAGTFGTQIVKALCHSKDYPVVLWVDKYSTYQPLDGYRVETISRLNEVSYDYVIIAVLNIKIAEEIERNLLEMQVPASKIAKMNADVIRESDLLMWI